MTWYKIIDSLISYTSQPISLGACLFLSMQDQSVLECHRGRVRTKLDSALRSELVLICFIWLFPSFFFWSKEGGGDFKTVTFCYIKSFFDLIT